MNIALVCPYDMFRPGGVQFHIQDVAHTLRELGHRATIIAPGPAPADAADDGTVYIGRFKKIPFNQTRFEISIALGGEWRKLKALMAREQFDVVHFHTIWVPLLPLQVYRLSSSAHVATFHDNPPPTFVGNITRFVFRMISRHLLPRLDGAIAVSEAPLGHLVSKDGRRPIILPPCTNLERFTAASEPLREYCDDRLNILYLSRMDQRKGIYQLLEAYREISQDGVPLRLLVGGGGEETEAVKQFAAANKLTNVVFLGPVAREQAPRYYASADIYCSPALYGETFGIVLVEAMSSGKPVVAAANSGYRTVLKGEGAKFLTIPGNVGDLVEKLRTLIADRDLRDRMGQWGRREAVKYDCRQVVPELVKIYESALKR